VADHHRRVRRRRATWKSLTRCLRCGSTPSSGEPTVIHTPPRRSSYDVDPTLARPAGEVNGANDALQNTTDSRIESQIPSIYVGSSPSDTAASHSMANVASTSAVKIPFAAADTRHTVVGLRTERVELTAISSSDSSTPPPSGRTKRLHKTDGRQVRDAAVDEQLTPEDQVTITTPRRSAAVEALLLDRDEPSNVVRDDSTQVRRASESPCSSRSKDVPSSRRRHQHSTAAAASDALRQALEKRINDRLTDTARNAQKQRQEKKQDRKAAKTLSAILLAFIVTWTPYNVFTVVRTFVPTWIDPTVYAIGGFFYLLRTQII